MNIVENARLEYSDSFSAMRLDDTMEIKQFNSIPIIRPVFHHKLKQTINRKWLFGSSEWQHVTALGPKWSTILDCA